MRLPQGHQRQPDEERGHTADQAQPEAEDHDDRHQPRQHRDRPGDRAGPCTVNSFAFLAKKHFFDNTKCHRLATPENSGLSLLQCGDPQAKADGKNPTDGQGSSGYVYDSENLGGIPYTRGTVAVAQAVDAVNQNGSQFWISLGDETQQVEKAYTPFGVVSQGLEILDEISKGGWITNPDDITGDGGSNAPKIPVVIKNVRLS